MISISLPSGLGGEGSHQPQFAPKETGSMLHRPMPLPQLLAKALTEPLLGANALQPDRLSLIVCGDLLLSPPSTLQA